MKTAGNDQAKPRTGDEIDDLGDIRSSEQRGGQHRACKRQQPTDAVHDTAKS